MERKKKNHTKIKVFIVDDQAIIKESLQQVLNARDDIMVVGSSDCSSDLYSVMETLRPDVVLMDIRLKEENGIEATRRIKLIYPDCRVIMLSGYYANELVAAARAAGASAYITKGAGLTHLVEGIRIVMKSPAFFAPEVEQVVLDQIEVDLRCAKNNYGLLTPREYEILKLIAMEYTTREISDILQISEKTIRNHKSNIMTKLGINSYVGLIKYAYYLSLI